MGRARNLVTAMAMVMIMARTMDMAVMIVMATRMVIIRLLGLSILWATILLSQSKALEGKRKALLLVLQDEAHDNSKQTASQA